MSVGLSFKDSPREVVRMKNTSGAGVVAGDVCVLKAVAAGDEITTTTTGGDNQLLRGGGFMAVETIANDAYGRFLRKGFTNVLKVNGTTDIAIGDRLTSFTTAGIAKKAAIGDPYFATALEAYATDDSSGVIDAILLEPGAEDPSSVSSSGGDLVVTKFAGEFAVSGAVLTYGGARNFVNYRNVQTDSAACDVKVPSGATSISGINFLSSNRGTGANIVLNTRIDLTADVDNSAPVDDQDLNRVYAMGGGTAENIEVTAFDAAAFDGIGAVTSDDVLHIAVLRQGLHASDTWDADWELWGIEVTFA